ncbi:MAG: RNA recognition motif domain-containing protein [Acidimicrobiia bacterium]
MSTNIYVGNLPFSTTSGELEELFAAHGTVTSAQVITDRMTGRSRGFGFVEMESDEAAQEAIGELNDSELEGRRIRVNVARERTSR